MRFWRKFRRDKSSKSVKEPVVEAKPSPEVVKDKYGMDGLEFFLMSGDYDWDTHHDTKKYLLINPEECEDKISLMGLLNLFKGTGHSEWEVIISALFINAVKEAIDHKNPEADITLIFCRDFTASGNRTFTREQVYNHIIRFFEIVSEDEDVVMLKFLPVTK